MGRRIAGAAIGMVVLAAAVSAQAVPTYIDVGGNNSGTYAATWAGLSAAISAASTASAASDVVVRISNYDASGGAASYVRQTSDVNTNNLVLTSGSASYRVTIEGGYAQDFSAQVTDAQGNVIRSTVDGNMYTTRNTSGTINTALATTDQAARVMTILGSGIVVMEDLVITGGGRQDGERTTNVYGAGLSIDTQARLTNLVVQNNTADKGGDRGGGVYLNTGAAGSVVEYCLFQNNDTRGDTGNGGGISVYSDDTIVANSVFLGNATNGGGKAAAVGGAAPTVVVFGCLFYNNTGAKSTVENIANGYNTYMANSTVADNATTNAFYLYNGAPRLYNNVFADNTGGLYQYAGTLRVGYDLLDDDAITGTWTDEGGNQFTAMLFADQANDDYSLLAASTMAIDKGNYLRTASVTFGAGGASVLFVDVNNSGATYQPLVDVIVDLGSFDENLLTQADREAHFIYTKDLAGNARVYNNAIDLGAYEYNVPVPEPAGLALVGLALLGLRKRRS